MYIASAYPNSALSAGALAAIALVSACSLAIWLILVFLAERSSGKDTRQPDTRAATLARPRKPAEDEHSETGPTPADRRQGAAA